MSESNSGVREKKKEETRARIVQEAMNLFLANGYEETTLDDIAEASGISRRTFFYYFKSKEDALLAYHGTGFLDSIRPTMLALGRELPPLESARRCLIGLMATYESPQQMAVDTLMRSTEALRAKKQAWFVKIETVLAAAMAELWPDQRDELAVVSTVVMGVFRLSHDQWRQGGGVEGLSKYLERNFARLDHIFPA